MERKLNEVLDVCNRVKPDHKLAPLGMLETPQRVASLPLSKGELPRPSHT